jgi:uncharacterized SAM-binding protein YcdF (DUF218 family)
MVKLRKRYILLAFLVALVFGAAAHRHILPLALKWLDIGEAPIKSKAVFVLFGDRDTRPFVAAALYKAGYVEEILMAVNKPLTDSKQTPPSHDVYERVFLHRGVPAQHIRKLGNIGTTNTMNESAVLREYLERNPEALVTVVTTHFHTRRTRWSFRRNLGEHAARLRYVSAPADDFGPDDWWLFPRGFELVFMEYIKLLGYWVFYGNARWVLGGVFLAIVAWRFYGPGLNDKVASESSTTESG